MRELRQPRIESPYGLPRIVSPKRGCINPDAVLVSFPRDASDRSENWRRTVFQKHSFGMERHTFLKVATSCLAPHVESCSKVLKSVRHEATNYLSGRKLSFNATFCKHSCRSGAAEQAGGCLRSAGLAMSLRHTSGRGAGKLPERIGAIGEGHEQRASQIKRLKSQPCRVRHIGCAVVY